MSNTGGLVAATSGLVAVPGPIIQYNASGGATGALVDPVSANRLNIPSAGLSSIAGLGDSVVAGAVTGYLYNALLSYGTSYAPIRSVGNFAVPGTRTDQIANQITSANLAGCALINGGINDIGQSVSEAVLRTNLIANWNALRALGVETIDLGLPPTNTGANVPRFVTNEIWRKLYCWKNGIRHADIYKYLAANSGQYASGLSNDGTHPNSLGTQTCLPGLVAPLSASLQRQPPLLAMTDVASDTAGFFTNAVSFAGGSTPANWAGTGSGGTLSVTAPDAGDFGSWLRCTCSTAVNAGFNPSAYQQLSMLGWNIGDRIATAFRIRWSDTGQALQVNCFLNGLTIAQQPLYQVLGGASGGQAYIYQENTIQAGTQVLPQFFANGTGYFEINRPVMVNLTQYGLASPQF